MKKPLSRGLIKAICLVAAFLVLAACAIIYVHFSIIKPTKYFAKDVAVTYVKDESLTNQTYDLNDFTATKSKSATSQKYIQSLLT